MEHLYYIIKKLFYRIELCTGEKTLLFMIMPQYADLCLADVLHCEVEPHSEARVAGIRADEEVKLKLTDVVNTAKISCQDNKKLPLVLGRGHSQHSTPP